MAHRDKKNGAPLRVDSTGIKYDLERKIFYTSDYDTWGLKKMFSFTVFCFLIKGLPENEEPEILREIASAVCNDDSFSFSIDQPGHPIFKEYRNFLEAFFADKYKIKKDRPSKSPDGID